jgi:sialate O-acetylesterase
MLRCPCRDWLPALWYGNVSAICDPFSIARILSRMRFKRSAQESLCIGDALRLLATAAFILLSSVCAHAEVRLPHVFSDHAVLQRDRPVRVWGWADPQEQVNVRFHAQALNATADTLGNWEVWLKPEAAGGPWTLTVEGQSPSVVLERKDILVGDVWFASGQSNMEFPLKGFKTAPLNDGAAEIAAANHPNIRMLVQRTRISPVRLDDSDDTWSVCSPENAQNLSAVAYFFGREIFESEHVPVGLIDDTWGGTPAQSWISPEGIADANLPSVMADAGVVARDQGRADQMKADIARRNDALQSEGKSIPPATRIPGDHAGSWTPGVLYNAMIAPYTKYAIKGVIWYQGESDAGPDHSAYYVRVFPALIADWRQHWGQGDFPFLYVQIASWANKSMWPTVRDAQRRTLAVANTGMAVTLDVGSASNIHPPDKQTVGSRLAQTAKGLVYGKSVEYASPMFVQVTNEGDAVRVWFLWPRQSDRRRQLLQNLQAAGRLRAAPLHARTVGRGSFDPAGRE